MSAVEMWEQEEERLANNWRRIQRDLLKANSVMACMLEYLKSRTLVDNIQFLNRRFFYLLVPSVMLGFMLRKKKKEKWELRLDEEEAQVHGRFPITKSLTPKTTILTEICIWLTMRKRPVCGETIPD